MLLRRLRQPMSARVAFRADSRRLQRLQPRRPLQLHVTGRRNSSSMHMQPITASSQYAVDQYDAAVVEYLSLTGNPVETLHLAVAAEPGFLSGHLLTAWLYVLGTGATRQTPTLRDPLNAALSLVAAGVGTKRERALTVAADAWANGRIRLATAMLEAQLANSPTDILVTRLLHDSYYSLGDARNLRDSVGRVLPYWDPMMPGFGRLLGMHAFGLEETLQYDRAEALGMQALNMDPDDVWALHAVVHVYEMGSRLNEGTRLLRETRDHWQNAKLFDHHMHWHWGIMALEAGDYAKALYMYDNNMTARRSTVFNAVDSASLLWRMDLADAPVRPKVGGSFSRPSTPLSEYYLTVTSDAPPKEEEETDGGTAAAAAEESGEQAEDGSGGSTSSATRTRWTEVARRIRPFLGQHITALNDIHIAMALAASGDKAGLAAHLSSMAAFAERGAIEQQPLLYSSGSSSGGGADGEVPLLWPSFSLTHCAVMAESVQNWGLSAHSSLLGTGNSLPAGSGYHGAPPHLLLLQGAGGSGVAEGQQQQLAASATSAANSGTGAVAGAEEATKIMASTSSANASATPLGPSSSSSSSLSPASPITALPPALLTEGALAALDSGAAVFDTLATTCDSAVVTRTVALDIAIAMAAYIEGDARTAASLLGRTRPHWPTIGGSNAQRDVLEITFAHALMQCGELRTARSVLSERVAMRFSSPQAYFLLGSCASLMGDEARAVDARNRAYVLGMQLERE